MKHIFSFWVFCFLVGAIAFPFNTTLAEVNPHKEEQKALSIKETSHQKLSDSSNLKWDILDDKINRLDIEMLALQKDMTNLKKRETVLENSDQQSKDTFHHSFSKESISEEGLSDLYGQIDAQNQVIADLTKKTEELSFLLSELEEKLKLTNADIDIRFKNLSQTKFAVASDHKIKVPQKKPDMKAVKNKDKAAYEKAYGLLKSRKYVEAEKALNQFIKDYPQSKLAGNANYWLGETYYARGQYEVAAGIFSDGLTKYEKNSKAPDNLLKLGMTMGRLKKKTEACGFLMLLPEKFPKANDVLKSRAKTEAKKLACPQ